MPEFRLTEAQIEARVEFRIHALTLQYRAGYIDEDGFAATMASIRSWARIARSQLVRESMASVAYAQ